MTSLIKRTCSAVTWPSTPSLGPSETRWWIRHGLIIRSFYAHKSKAITAHASSLRVLFSVFYRLSLSTQFHRLLCCQRPRYTAGSWTLIHASHPVLGFLDSRIERPSTILPSSIRFFQPDCHRTDVSYSRYTHDCFNLCRDLRIVSFCFRFCSNQREEAFGTLALSKWIFLEQWPAVVQ